MHPGEVWVTVIHGTAFPTHYIRDLIPRRPCPVKSSEVDGQPCVRAEDQTHCRYVLQVPPWRRSLVLIRHRQPVDGGTGCIVRHRSRISRSSSSCNPDSSASHPNDQTSKHDTIRSTNAYSQHLMTSFESSFRQTYDKSHHPQSDTHSDTQRDTQSDTQIRRNAEPSDINVPRCASMEAREMFLPHRHVCTALCYLLDVLCYWSDAARALWAAGSGCQPPTATTRFQLSRTSQHHRLSG